MQDLREMHCAEKCMLEKTTLERRRPYEANRQRLALAIRETVSHLDMAAGVRLLTAEEERLLRTFKRAFAAFQDSSSEVVAIGYVAESPAETDAARKLSAGKGQVAFDQAEITAQQLVTLLGAAGPSAEAVKAELGFPSVGTTWRRKLVWHTEHNQGTSTYRNTVLAEATYEGRPVHRISDGEKLYLYDKATGNWTATVRAGKELQSASPLCCELCLPAVGGENLAEHPRLCRP